MPPQSLIILGGGLAGGLTALALARRRPEIAVTIVEAGETLGGNHVWSFFESDLAEGERPLVEPLIVHRWPAYDVRFPSHRRTIEQPYQSIRSDRFDEVVRATLGEDAIVRGVVRDASKTAVTLDDGRTLSADAILDTRGGGDTTGLTCGWQKFVGQSFHLATPHGLSRPVVMDATVDQGEGYRFVYLLPFSDHELFIEDTYYSDTPDLDVPELTTRIADYARKHGWQVASPNHVESGVLPVIMDGDFERFWPKNDILPRAGARAALIQPLSSYSLPDAVRFAAWYAAQPDLAGADTRGYARRHWQGGTFYRMLSRLLFRAAAPSQRYRVLQRFYTLSEGLIARFYRGQSSAWDKFRILAGKPPVSIPRAIRAILETP